MEKSNIVSANDSPFLKQNRAKSIHSLFASKPFGRLIHLIAMLAIFASILPLSISAQTRVAHAAPAVVSCIAIPSYFYPGALWTQATSVPATSIMIVNPSNGPGTTFDQNYKDYITQARAKGVKIIGYVYTAADTNLGIGTGKYGDRPSADVKRDVDTYYSWYPLDGIFFDQVAGDSAHLAYYQDLASYVYNHFGGTSQVVLNPGSYPDESYMSIANTVLAFEGSYDMYVNYSIPIWAAKYPPNKFIHVVHTTAPEQMNNALQLVVLQEKKRVRLIPGRGRVSPPNQRGNG